MKHTKNDVEFVKWDGFISRLAGIISLFLNFDGCVEGAANVLECILNV